MLLSEGSFSPERALSGGSDRLFQAVKKWKSPKSPRIGEESGSSKDTHMTNGDDIITDNMSTQNFFLLFFFLAAAWFVES